MDAIEIDHAKCTKCRKCINECPCDVLSLNGKLTIKNTELCISCGHCAAICSVEAIKCNDKNVQKQFKILPYPTNLTDDKLLFHKKRSVRLLNDKIIKPEIIRDLIAYGDKAPSSHNFRKRIYLVITNPEEIRKSKIAVIKTYQSILNLLNPITLWFLSIMDKKKYIELVELIKSFKNLISEDRKGNDKVFRNSKCIICIAAPTERTHSKEDCLAAQQYMMLYGKTCAINSFIVGYAQHAHKTIEKIQKLPKGYSIFAVSAFGYANNDFAKEIAYGEPEIFWK